jgi:hypothetical protein
LKFQLLVFEKVDATPKIFPWPVGTTLFDLPGLISATTLFTFEAGVCLHCTTTHVVIVFLIKKLRHSNLILFPRLIKNILSGGTLLSQQSMISFLFTIFLHK